MNPAIDDVDRGGLQQQLEEEPELKDIVYVIDNTTKTRAVFVFHLLAPGRVERHRPWDEAEYREGRLFLYGALVA